MPRGLVLPVVVCSFFRLVAPRVGPPGCSVTRAILPMRSFFIVFRCNNRCTPLSRCVTRAGPPDTLFSAYRPEGWSSRLKLYEGYPPDELPSLLPVQILFRSTLRSVQCDRHLLLVISSSPRLSYILRLTVSRACWHRLINVIMLELTTLRVFCISNRQL